MAGKESIRISEPKDLTPFSTWNWSCSGREKDQNFTQSIIKGTKLKPNIHQKELKHEIAYLKITKVIRIVESGKRGLK